MVGFWYPARAVLGALGLFLCIATLHALGSIAAGIKFRKSPYIFMRNVVVRYFERIREAKFKRH